MDKPKAFTLNDICVLAELPRRTVRYYIQSGLTDRPHGVGKGAYYTQSHVEQLLLVRKWQLAGLSLERIGGAPAPWRSGAILLFRTASSSTWSQAAPVSVRSRFEPSSVL
jgi:hypothetical protein